MLAPSREFFIEVMDVAQARKRWQALQERAWATPFQTLEWCERLYAGPGVACGAEPWIVLVRDARTGVDIALLPLARQKRGGLRIVTFADFGLCDYVAPMVAKEGGPDAGRMARLWPEIVNALPETDLVHFDKIVVDFGEWDNPLIGLAPLREMTFATHMTPLPESWADYERMLSRRTRHILRNRKRKLEAKGTLKLLVVRGGEEAVRLFTILRRQRLERFAALDREDALRDDTIARFYSGLAQEGAGGLPIISAIEVDGTIVATMLGLIRDERYYMLAVTFEDGGSRQSSPGLLQSPLATVRTAVEIVCPSVLISRTSSSSARARS